MTREEGKARFCANRYTQMNHSIVDEICDDYEETIGALEDKYIELLQAVESKFENESRHETALRYITQHERSTNNPVKYGNDDG